jgi:hypothetical protein
VSVLGDEGSTWGDYEEALMREAERLSFESAGEGYADGGQRERECVLKVCLSVCV